MRVKRSTWDVGGWMFEIRKALWGEAPTKQFDEV